MPCLFALALSALGFAPARADQLPFVPPQGWTGIRPPAGLLGVWVHSGDVGFRQSIVVGRQRTPLTASAFDAQTIKQLRAALPSFVLGADQYTTTCGHPAHYISYASTNKEGQRIVYQHMTAVIDGYAWFAIYAKLAAQPSLSEARQALTTLCGLEVRVPPPGSATPPALPPGVPTPPAPPEGASPTSTYVPGSSGQ